MPLTERERAGARSARTGVLMSSEKTRSKELPAVSSSERTSVGACWSRDERLLTCAMKALTGLPSRS